MANMQLKFVAKNNGNVWYNNKKNVQKIVTKLGTVLKNCAKIYLSPQL